MPGSCFFFNDTATTEIYSLSLPDPLPISRFRRVACRRITRPRCDHRPREHPPHHETPLRTLHEPLSPPGGSSAEFRDAARSEEHTSELQSRLHLVCRLLLEKKKLRMHPQK